MIRKASVPPPNLRRDFARAAERAGVSVEDADRAVILGQIAELLVQHR